MESIRKGLRSGVLEKDTYERLACTECNEQLETHNDPDEIGAVKRCPSCGEEWRQLG
jgi:predicted RNA-binding Zn-ribbon protein involved in translation (DUF1610 family)